MPEYSAILEEDGDQYLEVSSTAVQLTEAAWYKTSGVNSGRAVCQVQIAPVLVTNNTTAPLGGSERTGTRANVGDSIRLNLVEIRNTKFIRATNTDAALFVRYEKATP